MNLKLHFAEEGQKAEEMATQASSYYHRKSRVCKTDQSQTAGLRAWLRRLEMRGRCGGDAGVPEDTERQQLWGLPRTGDRAAKAENHSDYLFQFACSISGLKLTEGQH